MNDTSDFGQKRSGKLTWVELLFGARSSGPREALIPVLFSDVQVRGDALRYVFGPEVVGSRIVTGDMTLDYEGSAGDLRDLPKHIQFIPGLLNVAPAIWYSGISVSVPFVDRDLEAGLLRIRDHFRAMYPESAWAGGVEFVGPVIEREAGASSGAAMLFSGGLDSVISATRHLDEDLTLITVGGADMASDEDESWGNVKSQVRGFAEDYGCRTAFVRGNIKECLNTPLLSNTPPIRKHGISWWGGAQHGMALSGLVAPIAYARGLGKLYLASTHTEDFATPWGSGPSIDGNIAWSGFRVIHDGFDTSRQQKIASVIAFSDERRAPRPRLRVCVSPFGDKSQNCGECEKCLRTMVGIAAEGDDPQKWGFPVGAGLAIDRAKAAFAAGKIDMKDDELFMWADIRDRAIEGGSAPAALKEWFATFDPIRYRRKVGMKQKLLRPLKTGLSKFPALYRAARTLAAAMRYKQRA